MTDAIFTVEDAAFRTDLPPLLSPFDEVMANGSLRGWWQGDADAITLAGGRASVLNNLVSGGAWFDQGTAGRRGVIQAGQIGPMESYGALRLQSASQQHYAISEEPDLTSPFTFAVLAKPAAFSSARTVLGAMLDVDTRAILNQWQAGSVDWVYGTSSVTIAMPDGQWSLLIVSYDGTNLKAQSGAGAVQSAVAAGNPAAGFFAIGALGASAGQYWDGWISDVWHWSYDLFSDTSALAVLKAHVSEVYGL